MHSTGDNVPQLGLKFVESEYRKKYGEDLPTVWQTYNMNDTTPRQQYGSSCGPWVLALADELASDKHERVFSNIQAAQLRQQIATLILMESKRRI